MNFTFEDLSLKLCGNRERFAAAVDYFAADDTPNDFFVAPVAVGSDAYGKEYWEGFAEVLIKRGVLGLGQDKRQILHWLEDFNWPGSGAITEFVRQNINAFLPNIIVCLSAAYETRDVVWFKNMLSLFYDKCDYAKMVVDYLEDDCWKDFDTKFKLTVLLDQLK